MNISTNKVYFHSDTMWVEFTDGRTLGVPLKWFPRLYYATPEQRTNLEISEEGLHWDEINEDISIAGILAGHGDDTKWGKAQRKRIEQESAHAQEKDAVPL